MTTSSNALLDDLASILINHLYVSQVTQVQTQSIQAYFYRENISLAKTQLNSQGSQIKFSSFCELLGSVSCNNRILTQKVYF